MAESYYLPGCILQRLMRHLGACKPRACVWHVFVLWAFMALSLVSNVHAGEKKHILLLNSYHCGFKWTDDIVQSIQSVFRAEGVDAEYHIEYMDTKRHFSPKSLDLLWRYYKRKYQNVPLDVVISSDDNAFNFLAKHHDTLFTETPVVFCGLNRLDQSVLDGLDEFTGLVEILDVKPTLDLALEFHPKTKRIAVISDETPTGVAIRRLVSDKAKDYPELAFMYLEARELTTSELLDRLRSLPHNTIALLVSWFGDKTGKYINLGKACREISGTSPVPVYGFVDPWLGHGIVGGKLISGLTQGEAAARIALRILESESPSNIPVLQESVNRYMFDHEQLKRWGLPLSELPPDSIIVNQPTSFYAEHKRVVWGVALFSVIQILIIFCLLANTARRRRAEEAVREQRDKAQRYLDVAGVMFVAISPDEKVSLINKKGCDVLGLKEEDVLGKNWFDNFVPARMREEIRGVFQKLMAGEVEPVKYYQNSVLTSGGEERIVAWHNTLLRDEERKITGTLSSGEDLTEQKLLEVQIHHAQKMEAVGTLAGGIAHNFNNLLMGIQGNTTLMLMDMDSSHPNYEMLKTIEKQIKSGATLTRELLGYARKGQYEVTPINMNDVIQDTSETFGRTRREVTIHLELGEDLNAIRADQGQIEQVLLNLYVNAADAILGSGDIILKTANVTHRDMKGKTYDPKPGNYVLLTVADTGRGMDKQTQKHIFEPFFTTKEMGNRRGTGLGLASVYGIVKAHAGYIDVDSKKGKGTTFGIYLPATEKKTEKTSQAAQEIIKGSGTILLVDDEEVVLDVGIKLLEKLGYGVLDAKSGREALEIFKENKDRIDVVLLDMIMPDVGGGEAYDLMKQINPDVKVLLSSGYSIDSQAKEILARGCDSFIQKPFTMPQLSQSIREVLNKK